MAGNWSANLDLEAAALRFSALAGGNLRRRAFTLVELLVVIAVIALLLALLLPMLGKAREQANRIKCASNQRQIIMAMIVYSHDDKHHMYLWTRDAPLGTINSLYRLHPARGDASAGPIYLRDIRAGICPSTRNRVDEPAHLRKEATSPQDESGAYSYEVRTSMDPGTQFADGYVVPRSNSNGLDERCWKTPTNSPNTSLNVVIHDADNQYSNHDINNWPDAINNHGAQGMNCGFLDGHVAFTLTGRPLLEAYMGGHFFPSLGFAEQTIFARWGLGRDGNRYYWLW